MEWLVTWLLARVPSLLFWWHLSSIFFFFKMFCFLRFSCDCKFVCGLMSNSQFCLEMRSVCFENWTQRHSKASWYPLHIVVENSKTMRNHTNSYFAEIRRFNSILLTYIWMDVYFRNLFKCFRFLSFSFSNFSQSRWRIELAFKYHWLLDDQGLENA